MVTLAMESGASVVTANKALLATYGPELYRTAAAHGVDLYFEAAVGGAIPIVHPLRESSPATGSSGCSASSTAPRTTSLTR